MPLGVLCKLGDEKDINADMAFTVGNFFKKIVTIDNSQLLFVVRNGNYFFEVKCKSLDSATHFGLETYGEISYYSHKYNKEEMKNLFALAMHNMRPIKPLYILSIEKMKSVDEIEKLNTADKSPEQYKQFWGDFPHPQKDIFKGLPKWSDNFSDDLSCSVHTRGRTIYFEIEYKDFTPHYNTDRDGGWYLYTHKEIAVGEIHFQTYYSLQEFLNKISSLEGIKYVSDVGCNLLECKLPFVQNGVLYFSGSVKDLFSFVGIRNYYTICMTFRDNVNYSDDDWIYGGDIRGPLWSTKNGNDPYPEGYLHF